ncbi:hypothetical protein [Sphingomonas sp. NIBR02145]|uniref:hypothetical protein n=1 Tax=Sphingomonas sp. NIBR02145 TaxID=3014784 RepID=UPI0022B50218|nr:hypothetical protein [Sphingomonas sp. NIBR02145]WHU02852.1 hypothetical protein O3305_22175 [Sphingomonas sp. NIBR02145]
MARAGQRILVSTLVAGTLDIAAAALLAIQAGRTPDKMLRGVASGPFPDAVHWGLGGAALGLLVHFAIMAVMAAVYILAADRLPVLKAQRLLAGILYGIATWAVMNLVVLPLRWPTVFPHLDLQSVATQLFCHIVLVGLPIALIAARR